MVANLQRPQSLVIMAWLDRVPSTPLRHRGLAAGSASLGPFRISRSFL
jgi:hypothetical protein